MKFSSFQNPQGGLIKTIVLVVIALLILSYLGFNLRALVTSPTTTDNFGYVKEATLYVWNNWLKKPADYLWNKIFIPLIWEPAIDNLTKMKNGEQNDIQSEAIQNPNPTTSPN